MWQEGVSSLHAKAVFSGIHDVLSAVGDVNLLKIRKYGVWRSDKYYSGGAWGMPKELLEYQSIDWYIEMARQQAPSGNDNPRRGFQLCADTLLTLCLNEPWQVSDPHYDVVVVNEDMYSGENKFIIGLAGAGIGTVISVCRFLHLPGAIRFECIKTETIHEMGHVFGLLPKGRTENVEESLGRHCANLCSMRQGLVVPEDWQRLSDEREAYGPFCDQCVADLRKFFC